MKNLTIQLSDHDADTLERFAARLGRTPEELAADLIHDLLKKVNSRNVSDEEIDRLIEEDLELLGRLAGR